jgi:hypothetical protein
MEEHIQDSMELVRSNEQSYQLELHAYQTMILISNTNPQVLCLWKLEPIVEFQQRHLWYNLLPSPNQLVH